MLVLLKFKIDLLAARKNMRDQLTDDDVKVSMREMLLKINEIET